MRCTVFDPDVCFFFCVVDLLVDAEERRVAAAVADVAGEQDRARRIAVGAHLDVDERHEVAELHRVLDVGAPEPAERAAAWRSHHFSQRSQ